MKRIVFVVLPLAVLLGFSHPAALAETRKNQAREPDSEYVEKDETPERREGSGIFSFLPFVGGNRVKVEPEKLEPTPPAQESKPVLEEKELQQLRSAAERWILTAEFGEPTVRRDENGTYYRDYIVFADEYEAKVLRGESEENPFIGHIYIKGDYFKTQPHFTGEEARSDFRFDYQSREFRLIFDRIEKWEYSYDPNDAPFTFVERWEFRGMQSRPIVNLSEDVQPGKSPAIPEGKSAVPQAGGG